jgi:hypothetical protein
MRLSLGQRLLIIVQDPFTILPPNNLFIHPDFDMEEFEELLQEAINTPLPMDREDPTHPQPSATRGHNALIEEYPFLDETISLSERIEIYRSVLSAREDIRKVWKEAGKPACSTCECKHAGACKTKEEIAAFINIDKVGKQLIAAFESEDKKKQYKRPGHENPDQSSRKKQRKQKQKHKSTPAPSVEKNVSGLSAAGIAAFAEFYRSLNNDPAACEAAGDLFLKLNTKKRRNDDEGGHRRTKGRRN